MNKCCWIQWELYVSCSGRLAPCIAATLCLALGSWVSAVIAGLILLPIFFLFLLFCALLLLNQSLAIREKLSLWPVIPLSFIMRFFSLHLTHLMPGSVRNEALDQRDIRDSGCTESSELQNAECCRCKSKNNTICTFISMKLHSWFLLTLIAAADRGDLRPSVIPQPQSFPAVSTSECYIPSSLFIDVPACRHVLISFSRLIIWLTSKLGTQLLPLLKDKKGQQDKGCFACL